MNKAKNKSSFMNNNLKLSYEMLFENGMDLDHAENGEEVEPEMFTHEEVQQRLEGQKQEWARRMEKERTEAEKQGYAKGLEEGKRQMKDTFEKQLSSVKGMLKAIEGQFDEVVKELKPQMANLVFDMTEKVLEVPCLHPKLQERVNDQVLRLVGELNEELHIKVSVAEEDYKIIQKALEKNENINHFTLRTEDSFNPGEYAVETKKETIIKNFKKVILDFKESVNFKELIALSPEN